MGIKRRELTNIYEDVKSQYRRNNRDKDIIKGIDVLYEALMNYMDGCYNNSNLKQN